MGWEKEMLGPSLEMMASTLFFGAKNSDRERQTFYQHQPLLL